MPIGCLLFLCQFEQILSLSRKHTASSIVIINHKINYKSLYIDFVLVIYFTTYFVVPFNTMDYLWVFANKYYFMFYDQLYQWQKYCITLYSHLHDRIIMHTVEVFCGFHYDLLYNFTVSFCSVESTVLHCKSIILRWITVWHTVT